jgi:hypothetical protein
MELHSTPVRLYVEFHKPLWVQHKEFPQNRADVVALRFEPTAGSPLNIPCINDAKFADLFHFVGADVFVVGYPIRREPGDRSINFPIWKRGSIATDMMLPWAGHPVFLIDSRTSGGMSGSPVYRRVFGPATSAKLETDHTAVVSTEFIGVYSGRLDDDDGNASIGLVWGKHVLQDILKDFCPGARE